MRNTNHRVKRVRSRRRRGVATVEAAILLPILIAVSLGATDVAQYINLAQSVTNASRQASRSASRDATETVKEVETAVREFFQHSFPKTPGETLNAAIEVKLTHLDGAAIAEGDLTSIESGSPIVVEVVFDFDAVRWFRGFDYLGSDVRRSTTISRRE